MRSIRAAGRMVISMACWRRSARLSPAFRKVETEAAALPRRIESRPAATPGKERAARMPIRAATMIISINVTPTVLRRRPPGRGLERATPLTALPTDDVGIVFFAARLPIGSEANDVRLIAMLARIFIKILTAPWIHWNILREVRTVPHSGVGRPLAQRSQ